MSEEVPQKSLSSSSPVWVIDLLHGSVSWSNLVARQKFGYVLGDRQNGSTLNDPELQSQIMSFARCAGSDSSLAFHWYMSDVEGTLHRCEAKLISLGAQQIGVSVRAFPCQQERALSQDSKMIAPNFETFQSLAFMTFTATGRTVSFSHKAAELFPNVGHLSELFAVSSAAKSFKQRLEESGHLEQEIRLSTLSGVRWYRIEAHIDRINDRIQLFAQDIQSLRDYEVDLYRLQNYDNLTHLPNRYLLYQQLEKAQVTAKKRDRMFGILYLDLDGFKIVNDTFGHRIGDQLLQSVSDRIKATIPSRSCLYRLGGDEFVVVMEHIQELDELESIAKAIGTTGLEPYPVSDMEMLITTSIGIACYPMHGVDTDSLLKNADAAMYQSKEAAHNGYRVYNEVMSESFRAYLTLGGGLRTAIEQCQFELYYQPKIRLSDEFTVGAEALLRWRHPELGMISPDRFIPIAEESGLILPLGEWVIREACRQLKAWQMQGLEQVSVSVNLSSRQFMHPDLVDMVRSALDETGVDPKYLELELTESMLMADANETVEKLHAFRKMGLNLSIDDFGTGYSSLAYLKKFPIQTLKIDRSFVQDLGVDGDDDAIVKATIAMANSLNLKVIAEGVENRQQIDALVGYECQEVQGFLFAKPMASDEFSAYMQQSNAPHQPALQVIM